MAMHIVIDVRFFARAAGGISRYSRALIQQLNSIDTTNRYTVVILERDQAEWAAFARQTQLSSERWRSTTTDIAYYTYAEQTRLPAVLSALNPDLVHFTNFNLPLLWNRPFIATIHDLTILNYPVGRRQKSLIAQTAFRWTIRHSLRSARAVITVSKTSREDLVKRFGAEPDKIHVTYEGVDEAYQPVNLPLRGRAQTHLQERYGIRAPYFLFVSQWRPHKGILDLVESYEIFRKTDSRNVAQLVITGKANAAFPEIPARIAASPFARDIVCPGFVDEADLPKLYQAAEAFVFPSLYEGFGLTPLEAMACGTPVLAANTSCLPEILEDAAILLAPDEHDEWARTMREIVSNRTLRRDLHAAGLARARTFSWRKMAQATLALYTEAPKMR